LNEVTCSTEFTVDEIEINYYIVSDDGSTSVALYASSETKNDDILDRTKLFVSDTTADIVGNNHNTILYNMQFGANLIITDQSPYTQISAFFGLANTDSSGA
jgi:hypothetical protein